jgi:hypothetical protein
MVLWASLNGNKFNLLISSLELPEISRPYRNRASLDRFFCASSSTASSQSMDCLRRYEILAPTLSIRQGSPRRTYLTIGSFAHPSAPIRELLK